MGPLTSPGAEYNRFLGGENNRVTRTRTKEKKGSGNAAHDEKDLQGKPLGDYGEDWRQLRETIEPGNIKYTIIGICCNDNVHAN